MLSYPPDVLQQHAKEAFEQNNYVHAALLYEQLTEVEPEQINHVWQLGLARLLAGHEAEAQFTWMMALSAAEPEQLESWTEDLVQVLQTEAEHQAATEAWQRAWLIRQHLREIAPVEINNLLHLVGLAPKVDLFDADYLESLEITDLLRSQSELDVDEALLLKAIDAVLPYWIEDQRIEDFIEAALKHIHNTQAVLNTLLPKAFDFKDLGRPDQNDLARYLAEICLRYSPNSPEILKLLASCYELEGRHLEAIEAARQSLAAYEALDEKMIAMGFLAIRLLRAAATWAEARDIFKQQKALMPKLLEEYKPQADHPLHATLMTFCSFYTYYLDDNPVEHRHLQNQLAALYQADLRFHEKELFEKCQKRLAAPLIKTERKLKIGYIARYMCQHPVGWLSRWLMQYHDKERFDIYTYHLHVRHISEFTHRWFVQPVTRSGKFEDGMWTDVAEHISQNDEIDILVDLDSITYSETCSILALKPAPIQVSWMGFDAPGIPAVDYFMADPYVLPETAQEYYTEKIWRLPNTYLAVDGFEVGVPTLRRDQLGIPGDAVIYLSAQDGKKRHPDTMRLQIKILREVPNSYLLIKGIGDEASLKEAFYQLADEEGVERDRLRFLKRDLNEPTHRANLGIADIVLDTYPYNGATTTLETLWMGVPIVTKVGQQWAARNSYTMLMNVGVTEGIARTNEEYLEWGVRMGTDAALRQDIHLRLLRSRQTSPLWNTRQFARDMENAYEQMWKIYTR